MFNTTLLALQLCMIEGVRYVRNSSVRLIRKGTINSVTFCQCVLSRIILWDWLALLLHLSARQTGSEIAFNYHYPLYMYVMYFKFSIYIFIVNILSSRNSANWLQGVFVNKRSYYYYLHLTRCMMACWRECHHDRNPFFSMQFPTIILRRWQGGLFWKNVRCWGNVVIHSILLPQPSCVGAFFQRK